MWTAPGVANQTAALPPAVVPANPLTGLAMGIISATGHWSNCDLWVECDDTWADVIFELIVRQGPIWAVIERKTLDDLGNTLAASGRRSGILFSARGRPCDEFRVRAFPTAVDHPQAEFRLNVWGDDGPTYGDRATRQPVDLWATPAQLRTFTTGLAGLPVGGVPVPTVVFAANPSGGRVAVTSIMWTTSDAGPRDLTLEEVTPAAVATVRATWRLAAPPGQLHEPWETPLYSARGNLWLVRIAAGAVAGAHFINVYGFNE